MFTDFFEAGCEAMRPSQEGQQNKRGVLQQRSTPRASKNKGKKNWQEYDYTAIITQA
jgi:hypothetical protein